MAPPHDHHQRLLALIDAEPASEGDPSGVPGLLRRLCSALTHTLPATWAGLSLAEDGQVGSTLTGSDRHAQRLENLQFDLGEGPCVESVATRRPVLEADVAGRGTSRWPAYGPAAQQHGVRSVFAFPLIMGAVCVGALDIYQDRPAALSPAAVLEATAFAALAVRLLESGQSLKRSPESSTPTSTRCWRHDKRLTWPRACSWSTCASPRRRPWPCCALTPSAMGDPSWTWPRTSSPEGCA